MRRRLIPLLLPVAIIAAACGQKAGVADDSDSAAPPATAAPPPATAAPGDTTQPGTGETTAPGTGEPGTSEPTGTAGPATTAAPVGPYEPGPNDTAGVSDDEIVIGVHAPVTGASPIPQESFDVGKDIYWQWLADNEPDRLFGRTVRVVFRDDTFNPQTAVRVCREMVEQEGAFLLVGGGGADQITACAQYANENGIPYISAGVNEAGLTDLDTYFASTLTYAEQAPMIADQLLSEGIEQASLVVADTPSFEDFHEAMTAAAEERGLEIVYENRINKDAEAAEAATVAQELSNAGAEGVILLTSPVLYVIGLAAGAANQSYEPVWIGPGITSGLNAVTELGCPNVANGEFYSPVPALDIIDELDPAFTQAYPEYAGGAEADDIGLQLWALNKALALMFEATGPELGRAALMNTLVTTPEFDNGIYPPIAFTPDDHFGGTGMHLLQADCEIRQYVTEEQFVEAG